MDNERIPREVGSSDGLGVTPPAMPDPLGYARVFTPWFTSRKLAHGCARTTAVYSQEQMDERDKQWLALLAARVDA